MPDFLMVGLASRLMGSDLTGFSRLDIPLINYLYSTTVQFY